MNQSDYNELLKEIERERQLGLVQRQMMSPGYVSQQQRGVQIPHARIEKIEREEDNTYVNVVIDHAEPTYNVGRGPPLGPTVFLTGEEPTASEYGVTKTEPILHNCSEYYCSVIRFTIPLDEVPLLICPIVPNQANPNLTPLIIGIQNGPDTLPTSFFSTNLIYLPQNSFTAPTQNQPTQVITPYYFIYSYQNLVDMINVALASSYVASGLSVLNPGYLAPYMQFDPLTGLFSIIIPSFMISSFPSPSIGVYFNTPMASFLTSFNIFGDVSEIPVVHPFGNDFFFVFNASIVNQFYPPGVTVPATTIPPVFPATSFYYKFTQEYSILEYWTSLRKILIFSNSIPVKNEYVPATNNLVNSINVDQSGVNVSYPILTDFVPNVSFIAGESRSIAYYVPSSQYRLVDLISTNPLQKIDIRIFWEDRDGNIYPLLISIYQQASLKLGFFRKELYKGTGLLTK